MTKATFPPHFSFLKEHREREGVEIELNESGIVKTPGKYYGIPWWGIVYLSVGYQRLANEGKDWEPDKLINIKVEDYEREPFKLHKSVKSVNVGRRGDGSFIVEEVT